EHFLTFYGMQELTAVLVRLPEVVRRDAAGCSAFLADFVRTDYRISNLGAFDGNGNVFCSAAPMVEPVNVADRAYFRRIQAYRRSAVGNYQIGRIVHIPVLTTATPAFDTAGKLTHGVFASINLQWLERTLASIDLPPNTTVALVDSAARIIIRHPDPEQWAGKSVEPLAALLRHAARTGKSTAEAAGLDGVQRIFAFAKVQGFDDGYDLIVFVGIPSAAAYGEAAQSFRINLAIFTAVALFLLVLAWFGSERLIVRQVNRLLAAARLVAGGQLNARANLADHGDEISYLGRVFDQMAGALEDRDRQKSEHLRHIQKLNRVYDVLSAINGVLLRVRDRQQLMDQACIIAVERGRFHAAWIGAHEPTTMEPVPVALAGIDKETILRLRLRDVGRNEVRAVEIGCAMDKNTPTIFNDTEALVRDETGAVIARPLDIRSAIIFPLMVHGQVVASFNLYAPEPYYFDRDEVRLLEELAADTGLGLQYIQDEQRLHRLINYDTVTGLPNRDLFEDRLEMARTHAHQADVCVAVAILRLRELGNIVNAFGRHTGDDAMRRLADSLVASIRESDTVAALGHDQIGIIFTDLPDANAVPLAIEQLLKSIPVSFAFSDEDVALRVSLGVAIYPGDGETTAEIVQNAERALNALDMRPGSRWQFFAPEVNSRFQRRLRIERALRLAIERQEFSLFYQPVLDIATRRTIGIEALLRWQSADIGSVPPIEFIPVAEETGLIVPIGYRVLETAARQAARWRKQGVHDARIAVNLSVVQLRDFQFIETIGKTLRDAGGDPDALSLGIEITESQLIESNDKSIAVLHELGKLGFHIAIDDFGTGYSSLGYLKRLPISAIKIDRSFIRDLTADPEDTTLVRTMIVLAHEMGLSVVAEGIETEAQFDVLRSLGCDAGQGYLFSKPRPANQIPRFFGVVGGP
ncbi:MAG: EAL domain-containing protein, partial [Rhodospirillales bacterium]|nr:EAL domain-containing protein [Rhodospirillales bacterium]